MSSDFKLTETEQQILNEVHTLLGNHLSDYLLSGLSEAETLHCRAFTARSSPQHRENVTYSFEIRSESEQGLPRGRDPLVLAALLVEACKYRTLTHTVSSTLRFLDTELIEQLDWPSSDESRWLIKHALERYLLTEHYLIDPTTNEDDLVFHRYSLCSRVVVGYGNTFIGMNYSKGEWQSQVMFATEFIAGILTSEKRFLGLDFQRLFAMREVTAEEMGSSV